MASLIRRKDPGQAWETEVDTGGGGSGSSPIEREEIVLDDAQIKSLLTPIALILPDDPDHIPVLTDIMIVLDDSNGVYTDADMAYDLIIGYLPDPTSVDSVIMNTMTIANDQFGSPGPGIHTLWIGGNKAFPLGVGANGAGVYWGQLGVSSIGTPPQPSPGTIGIAKDGASEYAGGGTGNTLTLRLQYSQLKVVP